MKVMHILDSLNRGGAETLALDVCRNARASGLDLILAATGGGDLEEEFRRSGAEFVRLQRRLPVDPRLAADLRRLIGERGVRVVHTHQAVEALHAHLATAGTAVRRVMSFHLCAADAKNRLALKLLAPRTDANLAVSRDLLACLKSEGFDTAKNFRVLYNGVDARRIASATEGGLREELGLAAGELLLGMVGNFYPDGRKDQLTVCRALVRVFAEFERARFVFVGGHTEASPRLYDECVSFCRAQGMDGRVRFLGKRADIPRVLAALDLFVLSSRADTFGVAAVEAMLAGVPAVLSDIGPFLEVSGGGRYAAVFRTGDWEDLARALLDLLRDEGERKQLGAGGREWARQQFGIEAHLARLRALYEEITAAAR